MLPVVSSTTTPLTRNASSEREQRREQPLRLLEDAVAARRGFPARARRAARARELLDVGSDAQAAASFRPPPVIAMPSSSSVDRRRVLADDLALEDDEDAVGEREDLLELERDEQDRLGPRRAPRSGAGARPRSRRRRARASAGRRSAPSGRGRSRARGSPSAGCRPTARPAGVSGPAAADVELADQLARLARSAAAG